MLKLVGAVRFFNCSGKQRTREAFNVQPIRERGRLGVAGIVGVRAATQAHNCVYDIRIYQRTVACKPDDFRRTKGLRCISIALQNVFKMASK